MNDPAANYQPIQTAPAPNYSPVPNYVPVQNFIPSEGTQNSRLMNTKIVRIRVETKCVCEDLACAKPFFKVNTVSKIDDVNPQNENEMPFIEGEIHVPCWCPEPIKFEFIDAQTRQPFSTSYYRDFGKQVGCNGCCCESYFIFPDIIHSKNINPNDAAITQCYDSRSFYRTFHYNGAAFYKIGEPYVPKDECCKNCCTCCKNPNSLDKDGKCCDCCNTPVKLQKRTYVDIFNMSDQPVGKYVRYLDTTGCCCSQNTTLFFEIYFPPDANEMLKLALIGQLVFLLQLGMNIFDYLPGSDINLNLFTSELGNI